MLQALDNYYNQYIQHQINFFIGCGIYYIYIFTRVCIESDEMVFPESEVNTISS